MEVFAEQSDDLCFSPYGIIADGYWLVGAGALKVSHLDVLLEIFIFFSDRLQFKMNCALKKINFFWF